MSLYSFQTTQVDNKPPPAEAVPRAEAPAAAPGLNFDFHSPLPGTIRSKLLAEEMILRAHARASRPAPARTDATARFRPDPLPPGILHGSCGDCARFTGQGALCKGCRADQVEDRPICWRGLDGKDAYPLDCHGDLRAGQERFYRREMLDDGMNVLIEL